MGIGRLVGGTARAVAVALALAAAQPAASADLRKCVGPGGKVSYVDGPCATGAKSERMRPASGAPEPVAATNPGAWVRYYEIEGIEHAALLEAMNRLGPKGFHAYATWNVSYGYRTAMKDGRCAVALVEARMKGDILMPRWTKRHGASADLVARWQRYEAALLAHEEGHLDIGRELARVVEADLQRVPPAADCRALDAAVRARYDTLLKGFSSRDKEYDQRTQHGRTQGAVFR
jgi:predicted secreted Zn-dependent protease